MSSIDERIVSMKFDNADFEKGISQTLDSLDKLNKSIEENTKSNNAFSGLQNSLDKLDFSSIGDNIESIADKFNVWGIVGAKVITDLTAKAEQMASKMMKAVTGADYAKEGWSKYGQKTANVATLYSQGYDMDTVTSQLEKLMWYTDETSYNFTDMVGNIAKFTATGQDLKTSVTAMEGIANWAATAGQGATQASRAMYQLSQAMGKGALKYDDYRSIQNFSMDTQEFRKKSLEAAEALGTLKKVGTDSYVTLKGHAVDLTDFTSYMSTDMWYTSDVMMKVFNEYSEGTEEVYNYIQEVKESTGETITASEAMERLGYNMSDFKAKAFLSAQECKTFADALDALADAAGTSWMTLFETIFGGYLEAKTLWTGFANELWQYVTAIPNALNDVMTVWKDMGGRTKFLESIVNVLNAINHLLNPIAAAFGTVFGGAKDWGSLLSNGTSALERFTAALKISNTTMSYIYTTAAVFFSVIKNIFQVLTPSRILAIGSALIVVKSALAILSPTTTIIGKIIKLVKILIGLGIFTKLTKGKISIDAICKSLSSLITKLTGVKTTIDASVVKGLGSSVWGKTQKAISATVSIVGTLYTALKEVGVAAKDLVKNFDLIGKTKTTWGWIKDFGDLLKSSFKDINLEDSVIDIINTIKDRALNFIDWIKATFESLKTGEFNFTDLYSDILLGATQLVTDIVTVASNGFNSIITGITNLLTGIEFEDPFAIKAYAAEVGEEFGETSKSIKEASDSATELATNTSEVTDKVSATTTLLGFVEQRFGIAASLVGGLVTSISNLLSGAVNFANAFGESVSNIKTETLKEGASALDLIAYCLGEVMSTGSQINWSKVIGVATILLYITAIDRFSKSINVLGTAIGNLKQKIIGPVETAKTMMTSIGNAFTQIGNYFKWLTQPTYTLQFKSLATSILMLAAALGILALIPADRLEQIVVVMGLMAAATAICAKSFIVVANTVKPEVMFQLATSLLVISAAFVVFVGAIKLMSSTMDKYMEGSGTIDGLLKFAVVVATTLVALYTFVGAIALLGKVQPVLDKGAIGIAKIAASLGLLGIAMLTFNVAIRSFDSLLQSLVTMFGRLGSAISDWISSLMKINDFGEVLKVLASVFLSIVAVGAVIKAITGIFNVMASQISLAGLKLGVTILAIAAAIAILSASINGLSKMENASQGIGSFIVVVSGLAIVINQLNKLGLAETMSKFGLSMLGFAGGVALLVMALKMCRNLTYEDMEGITNGIVVLGTAMITLAIACKMVDGVEIKSIATGLLSLVASLYLLVPLIALFGVMDLDVIGQGVALVGGMLLALSKSMQMMNNVNAGNLVKSMTAVTIELVAFGLVITSIANSGASWQQIAASAAGLAAGMVLISIAAQHMADAMDGKKWTNVVKSAGMMIVLAGGLVALAYAVNMMQGLSWDQMIFGAASLSIALAALSGVVVLVSRSIKSMDIGQFLTFLGTMTVGCAAMVGIAYAINMMAATPVDTVIAGMEGLSVTFIAMAAGLSIMAAAFTFFNPGAKEIVPILLSASVAIIAIAAALSLMAMVPMETIGQFETILLGLGIGLAALAAVFNFVVPGVTALVAVLDSLALVFISFGAAAALFGIGATLVGVGANLITLAFTTLSNALITLMPNVQMFLTYLTTLIPLIPQLSELSGIITSLGVAFGVFGVGCGVVAIAGGLLAVALIALAFAVNQASVAFVVFGAAFNLCATSISTGVDTLIDIFFRLGESISGAFDSVQQIIEDAKTWGSHLVSNFVSGITEGIDNVATAAANMAKTIWDYIHYSSGPEKGALKGDSVFRFGEEGAQQWAGGWVSGGQKYIPKAGATITDLMEVQFDDISETAETKGEESSEAFYIGMTENSGSADGFDTTVENQSGGALDNIATFFENAGIDTGNGFIAGVITSIQDGLGKIGATLDVSDFGSISDALGGLIPEDVKEFATKIKEDGIEGVLSDIDASSLIFSDDSIAGMEDASDIMDELTDSTEGLSGATSDLGGSSSSAAKSTAELAEEQKKLAKYEAYSTAVTDTFLKAYGGALQIVGDTEPTEAATEAFDILCQKIYEGSQDSSDAISDSTEDATDKIMEMKEAFIEAFESIADSVSSSIDVFTEFDKHLDEVQEPKDLIKNYQDQVNGIKSFYEDLNTLALKGFSDDVISSLIDEGVDAYPKMASMIKATAAEVEVLNQAYDKEANEALGYEAAVMAMTARMTAIQIQSFKEKKAAHDHEQAILQEAEDAYQVYAKTANEAYAKGIDIESELQDENTELGKSYKELREKMEAAGLADEDLNKAMESGEGFETEDDMIAHLNETLDDYREKAKVAAAEGEDIAQTSLDTNTELGQSYAELMEAAEACGFTVEDLYDVMYNNASFVAQYDYVQGLIDIYANCKSIISQFEVIGDGIFDNVQSQVESAIGWFDEFDNEFEMTADDLRHNLQSQLEGIAQYSQNLTYIAANGGEKLLSEYGDKITPEIANALVQGGESLITYTQQTFDTLAASPLAAANAARNAWYQYGEISGMGLKEAQEQAFGAEQILADMGIIGQNIDQGLANGMTEYSDIVTTAASGIGTSLVASVQAATGVASPSLFMIEVGKYIDEGLRLGIIQGFPAVQAQSRSLCTTLVNTFKTQLSVAKFTVIGRQICQGLINGIRAGRSGVINAAVETAKAAFAAACAALNIESPSKKMFWVGQMFDAGFANGITKNSGKVEDSVTDAMNGALSTAYDLLTSDVDVDPTITPILDLSDVQNGADTLSAMMANQGFGINATLGNVTTPADLNSRLAASINGFSNSDVVSAVMSLKSDISSLGNKVASMQIVLDTGVLAGGVTEGVSQNINDGVKRKAAVWA